MVIYVKIVSNAVWLMADLGFAIMTGFTTKYSTDDRKRQTPIVSANLRVGSHRAAPARMGADILLAVFLGGCFKGRRSLAGRPVYITDDWIFNCLCASPVVLQGDMCGHGHYDWNSNIFHRITAGGMVSVCLADFFNLQQTLMANCTIPHVVCLVGLNR